MDIRTLICQLTDLNHQQEALPILVQALPSNRWFEIDGVEDDGDEIRLVVHEVDHD